MCGLVTLWVFGIVSWYLDGFYPLGVVGIVKAIIVIIAGDEKFNFFAWR